jgi:hypothetical protein
MKIIELKKLLEKDKKENDYIVIGKINETTDLNVQPVINTRMGMKEVKVRTIRHENGHKKNEIIYSLNARINDTVKRMYNKIKLKGRRGSRYYIIYNFLNLI